MMFCLLRKLDLIQNHQLNYGIRLKMIQGQKIDSCGISSTTTAQKKTCLLSETLFFLF